MMPRLSRCPSLRRRSPSLRGLPRAAAFTLMEILVALLIAALVMTSVLSSLDYTSQAVDAIHNVIETESAGPRIMALVREDLSRLAVYDAAEYRILKGNSDSLGGADADRIDFLVYRRSTRPRLDPVTTRMQYSPLVEVGYRVRRNPRSSDFLELYRREDFLHDDKPFEDGSFTLLYDRLINWDVLYYEKPEYDPVWEEEWDSSEMEALPYAIEFRMELEIQPRRSSESLAILGSNRARLEFQDILTVPEPVRWVFRNRLHPVLPTPPAAAGAGLGGPGEEGEGEGPPEGAGPGTGQPARSSDIDFGGGSGRGGGGGT